MEVDALAVKTNPGVSSKQNHDMRIIETGANSGRDGHRTIKFENGSVYHGKKEPLGQLTGL